MARNHAFAKATAELIEDFQSRTPVRTGSLIISLFGDAVAPHGGTVWLGSLIEALQPFGINQRAIRTAVFRLAKDGWLASNQIGRRSYYGLTEEGRGRFQAASRRIYGEPRQDWPGTWCLALLGGVDSKHREIIRKELGWLGFAPLSSNLLAHPAPDRAAVEEQLASLPGNDSVVIMTARADDTRIKNLKPLVHQAWAMEQLDQRYADFLKRFRPVLRAAGEPGTLDPEDAFHVRILLVHEYRKILLRDPMLPEAMLPGHWDGIAAYQLCRNIYHLVSSRAEIYLTNHMESADGSLPPAEPRFYQRFGTLPQETA